MNRKIKFRAWDTAAHEWNKKNDINFNGNLHKQREMYEWELLRDYSMDVIDDPGHFVLMQYTGLKDKNAKEIYEGDILNCIISFRVGEKLQREQFTSKVAFEGGMFCIYHEGKAYQIAGSFEVIGNIFQNPDLIQKGVTHE
jgi:uncharacterized phage protein (TIGR01671 family)